MKSERWIERGWDRGRWGTGRFQSRAHFWSRRRGSIFEGALYPMQTTKISAEVLREAAGLWASTFVKSCLQAYIRAV